MLCPHVSGRPLWVASVLFGALATGCGETNTQASRAPASADRPPIGASQPLPTAAAPIVPSSSSELDRPISAAELKMVQARVEAAIDHVRQRDLRIDNAFWTIFHGFLCFGPGITLLDPASGEKVIAIDYLLAGKFDRGKIRGLNFIPTPDGLDIQMGPTFVGQGHRDQFIAKIAQWDIPIDRPLVVGRRQYAVKDLVNEAMAHTRRKTELSWTIVGLGWYSGTNSEWVNNEGEKIRFVDLVQDELEAPVIDAACGGTHRLGGLTWALHLHLRNGGKLEGVWKKVDQHIEKHERQILEWQNPDRSFSTGYFANASSEGTAQERIGSTGHQFEFLATCMTDAELRDRRVVEAAGVLSQLLLDNQNQAIESGALYHATHGLVLYHQRVFKKK